MMTMKWKTDGFKSDMACARGLGTAHHGTSHWMHQRLTAFAGVFLGLWLIFGLKYLIISGGGFDQATSLIGAGLNPVFFILAILILMYHAALGIQVILEDYLHDEGTKMVALILSKLAFLFMTILCVFSILKIAFTM